MTPLLLTFYGDDFTGSTDAMEALSVNGVPAVLFLAPPSPQENLPSHWRRVRPTAGLNRWQCMASESVTRDKAIRREEGPGHEESRGHFERR